MPKKRVLLVDDNSVVRSLVRQLCELEPDFEISGEAENGRDAVEKAENLKPDVIILDLSMPVMTGLDAAPLLRKLLPDTRVILFTVQEGSGVERLARCGWDKRGNFKESGSVQTDSPSSSLAGVDRTGTPYCQASQRQLGDSTQVIPVSIDVTRPWLLKNSFSRNSQK